MYKIKIFLLVFLFFVFSQTVNAKTVYVLITGSQGDFYPKKVTIEEGDTVFWRNQDSEYRNVSSNDHPTHEKFEILNIGNIISAGDASRKFSNSGVYDYHDHLFPLRGGTITVKDIIAPNKITDLQVTGKKFTSVDILWTETGDNGNNGVADHYDIRYSIELIDENSFSDAVLVSSVPAPIAAGVSRALRVDGLNPDMTYYFALKLFDEVGNSSGLSNVVVAQTKKVIVDNLPNRNNVVSESKPNFSKNISLADYFNNKNNIIDLGEVSAVLSGLQKDGVTMVRNVLKENENKKKFISVAKTAAQVNFLTYGFSLKTNISGVGQRAALLYSFLRVHNRLPISKFDWQDILKVSEGKYPIQRNLDAERRALVVFQRIYGRNPIFRIRGDENAIWIIAYGIQSSVRDISKEIMGIKVFREVYQKIPSTTEDWDIVRAIGYSGAVR